MKTHTFLMIRSTGSKLKFIVDFKLIWIQSLYSYDHDGFALVPSELLSSYVDLKKVVSSKRNQQNQMSKPKSSNVKVLESVHVSGSNYHSLPPQDSLTGEWMTFSYFLASLLSFPHLDQETVDASLWTSLTSSGSFL